MEYLLKASAVIALFYLFYKLLLQKDTFFKMNRVYLLLGLCTAFCIPLIIIPIYIESTSALLYDSSINNTADSKHIAQTFSILQLVELVYILGVSFFSIRFIIQIVSLATFLRKQDSKQKGKYTYIETTKKESPFSFFNWIIYNPNLFNKTELNQIIAHEKVHAKQYHTIDILVTQISSILLWFNPFIWLYNKDLKQNLEFLADQNAQQQSTCKKSYEYTLLKTSMPTHQLTIINNFYNSLIKKRIVMLHKSKSKKTNAFKLLLILPLLALFLMSFNTENIYIEKQGEVKINKPDNTKDIKIVFTKDLSNNDLKSIKARLKKNNIDFTYSNLKRNAKGEITSITAIFKNKNGSAAWNSNDTNKPIVPFYFHKSDKTIGVGILNSTSNNNTHVVGYGKPSSNNITKIHITEGDSTTTQMHLSETKNPLFIIDNKDSSKTTFDSIGIDPKKIHSVSVLKGAKAIKAYGEKGKNGVVIIVTKKGNASNSTLKTQGSPLYIIDGKKVKKIDFEKLNSDNIKKFDVLKDSSAIKKYGNKGKHGVIEITTKTEN